MLVDRESTPVLYRLFESNSKALLNYQPRPYQGTVTLFRARVQPLVCSFDRHMGWDELAESIQIRDVPGSHSTMIRPPHLQGLIGALRESIKAAGE